MTPGDWLFNGFYLAYGGGAAKYKTPETGEVTINVDTLVILSRAVFSPNRYGTWKSIQGDYSVKNIEDPILGEDFITYGRAPFDMYYSTPDFLPTSFAPYVRIGDSYFSGIHPYKDNPGNTGTIKKDEIIYFTKIIQYDYTQKKFVDCKFPGFEDFNIHQDLDPLLFFSDVKKLSPFFGNRNSGLFQVTDSKIKSLKRYNTCGLYFENMKPYSDNEPTLIDPPTNLGYYYKFTNFIGWSTKQNEWDPVIPDTGYIVDVFPFVESPESCTINIPVLGSVTYPVLIKRDKSKYKYTSYIDGDESIYYSNKIYSDSGKISFYYRKEYKPRLYYDETHLMGFHKPGRFIKYDFSMNYIQFIRFTSLSHKSISFLFLDLLNEGEVTSSLITKPIDMYLQGILYKDWEYRYTPARNADPEFSSIPLTGEILKVSPYHFEKYSTEEYKDWLATQNTKSLLIKYTPPPKYFDIPYESESDIIPILLGLNWTKTYIPRYMKYNLFRTLNHHP